MTRVRIRWRVEAEFSEEFECPEFVAKLSDEARSEWAVEFLGEEVADDEFHPVMFERDLIGITVEEDNH